MSFLYTKSISEECNMKLGYLAIGALLFLTSCSSLETIDGHTVDNDLLKAAIVESISRPENLTSISTTMTSTNDYRPLYGGLDKGITVQEQREDANFTAYKNDIVKIESFASQTRTIDKSIMKTETDETVVTAYTPTLENQTYLLNFVTRTETKSSGDPHSYTTYEIGQDREHISVDDIIQEAFTNNFSSLISSSATLYKVSNGYRFYQKAVTTNTLENELYPTDVDKTITTYNETVLTAEISSHDDIYRLDKIVMHNSIYVKTNFLGETIKDKEIETIEGEMNFKYGNRSNFSGDIPTQEDYNNKISYRPTLYNGNNLIQFTDLSNNYQALTGKDSYLYRYTLDRFATSAYSLKVGSTDIGADAIKNDENISLTFTGTSFTLSEAATKEYNIYLDVIIDADTHAFSVNVHYGNELID